MSMRRNVPLLAAAQAMMMSAGSLQVAAAGLVGLALSPNEAWATLPLALQFIATMLTSIPASLLMGRIGRKAGFFIGVLLGAAGAVLAAQAIMIGSFEYFCLATMLIGAFNGFGSYYRFAAADSAPEDKKAKAISWVMLGGLAAAFIGPNLANHSRDLIEGFPFAASYLGIFGLQIISLLVIAFLKIPKPVEEDGTDSGRPILDIARQPRFVLALLSGMLGYAIMTLVMTATPLAMKGHHHGFDDTAFVIQWHVFAMFAPSFFTGNLIARFGVMKILAAGALLNFACVMINLMGTSVVHFWTALFLLGVAWNFLFVGATALLTETYRPEERAKTQAVNDFSVFTMVSLASLSAGALQHAWGWQPVNIGVIPAIAVILIALLWVQRREKRVAELVGENA